MIGMHGAMESQSGFARLVSAGDGFDERNVGFLREAMVVDNVVKTIRPTFFVQAGLALGLVHFEKDIPLGGDALADPFAYDVLLLFVVMAATARDHQCLERLLAVMISKGRKLEHKC